MAKNTLTVILKTIDSDSEGYDKLGYLHVNISEEEMKEDIWSVVRKKGEQLKAAIEPIIIEAYLTKMEPDENNPMYWRVLREKSDIKRISFDKFIEHYQNNFQTLNT